jgi:hypothetical protein
VAYDNLRKFFDPALKLPIGDVEYRIPQPNARDGLRLRMLFIDPSTVLDARGESEEIMRVLGATWEPDVHTVPVRDPRTGKQLTDGAGAPVTTIVDRGTWVGGVYQQMVDDGVSWPEIIHAGRTALLHYGFSERAAENEWTNPGGEPTPGKPRPPKAGGKKRKRHRRSSKASTGSTTHARAH